MNKRGMQRLAFILSMLVAASNEHCLGKANNTGKKFKLKNKELLSLEKQQHKNKNKTITVNYPLAQIVAAPKYYLPYIQFGATRYFGVKSSDAGLNVNLFIPLWQRDLSHLVFSELRVHDRSGPSFEGNFQVGYRHLFGQEEQMVGVYGSFDRRRSGIRLFFNQIVVGGEYWHNKWFVGGNIYKPIGVTSRPIGEDYHGSDFESSAGEPITNILLTTDGKSQKALSGADAEVGYEFMPGLVGYAGGYYFTANDTRTIVGPRVRVTYDWSLDNNRRILGVFDKVGLEGGLQHDGPRGTVWYLSANFRIGWLPEQKRGLKGVARHMIDPVRRDPDIVTVESIKRNEPIKVGIQKVVTKEELAKALQDPRVHIIDVHGRLDDDSSKVSTASDIKVMGKKHIIFKGHLDTLSFTGHSGKQLEVPIIAVDPSARQLRSRGNGAVAESDYINVVTGSSNTFATIKDHPTVAIHQEDREHLSVKSSAHFKQEQVKQEKADIGKQVRKLDTIVEEDLLMNITEKVCKRDTLISWWEQLWFWLGDKK